MVMFQNQKSFSEAIGKSYDFVEAISKQEQLL